MNSRHRIDIEPTCPKAASCKPLKTNYNVQTRPKSSNVSLLTKTHKPGDIPSYIKRPSKLILEAQLVEKQRKYATLKETLSTTQAQFDIQHAHLLQFQSKLERLGWIGKIIKVDAADLKTPRQTHEFCDKYEGDSNTGQQQIESSSILSSQTVSEALQVFFLDAHADLDVFFAEEHEPNLSISNEHIRNNLKNLERNVAKLFSTFSNPNETSEQSFPASTEDIGVGTLTKLDSTSTQTDPGHSQIAIEKIRDDQYTVATKMSQLNSRVQEIESLSALQHMNQVIELTPVVIENYGDSESCKKPLTSDVETNTTDDECKHVCIESGDFPDQNRQYLIIKSLLFVKSKRIEQKNRIIQIMGQHFRRELNRFSKQCFSVTHQYQEMNHLCEAQKTENSNLRSQVDELQIASSEHNKCIAIYQRILQIASSEHNKCIAIYQRILRVRCDLLDMIKKKCTLRPYYLVDIFADFGSRLPLRTHMRQDPATRANEMCDLFASLNDKKQRTIINVLEEHHKRNLHARTIQLNRIARLEKQVAYLQLQLRRSAHNAQHDTNISHNLVQLK